MNMNQMNQPSLSAQDVRIEATNAFFRSVYQWMAAGLILTAVMAHFVASSPYMINLIFGSRGVFLGLIVAELALVMAVSWGINRISAGTAMVLFALYSLVNGATLSVVLLAYTGESVFSAFLTTAGMFGAMSVYGLFTKRDLTSWRSFLYMGLWGLIIAMLLNFFFKSGTTNLVISAVGILIFLGLTAYDTQYLRNLGEQTDVDAPDGMGKKLVIIGALHLYLDFVNLFLYLLRFVGKKR